MEENLYPVHTGAMLGDTIVKSFESIVDTECTKLILGTMPGLTSLDKNRYYSHSDNIFWDIIVRVLNSQYKCDTVESVAYEDKIALLLKNKIALWDVLKHCNRKGNLDSSIRDAIKNDFDDFFARYPKIKTIIFIGQNAEKYFNSTFKDLPQRYNLTLKTLPSTSPSHTLNAFIKLKEWRQVLSPDQS